MAATSLQEVENETLRTRNAHIVKQYLARKLGERPGAKHSLTCSKVYIQMLGTSRLLTRFFLKISNLSERTFNLQNGPIFPKRVSDLKHLNTFSTYSIDGRQITFLARVLLHNNSTNAS